MPRAPGVLVLTAALATLACSRRDAPEETVARVAPAPPTAAVEHREKKSEEPKPATPPRGYKSMTIGGVAPTTRGNAVVLTDAEEAVGVLIFVGGTEALSLSLRLQRRRYDRPLTHDLMDNVINELGGKVTSARVDKLENNVFHATLVVHRSGEVVEIDARASDALAMALGASAPIYVAERVVEQAGVDLKNLDVRPPESFDPEKPLDERPGVEL